MSLFREPLAEKPLWQGRVGVGGDPDAVAGVRQHRQANVTPIRSQSLHNVTRFGHGYYWIIGSMENPHGEPPDVAGDSRVGITGDRPLVNLTLVSARRLYRDPSADWDYGRKEVGVAGGQEPSATAAQGVARQVQATPVTVKLPDRLREFGKHYALVVRPVAQLVRGLRKHHDAREPLREPPERLP